MGNAYWPDANRVDCPFAGSIAIAMNDLIWQDSAALVTTAYNVLPASSMTTDGGSKAGSQAYLAPRFMGVAKEALSASQTRRTLLVDRVYVGPMTITSGTYYQGDLVTFYSAVDTGAGISNTRVEKTNTASSAIGFVVKDSGGTVTTVTVCLISRVLPKYMPVASATNAAGMTMDDGANIAFNTTTGTKLGTATGQKLGFWNATPVIQQASANQGIVNCTVGDALATNASVQNTGFGYATNTIADGVITNLNALRVDVLAINTLVNRLRLDLVTTGIIKGGA